MRYIKKINYSFFGYREREKFLLLLTSKSPKLPRQPSIPWTFIDEADDDVRTNSDTVEPLNKLGPEVPL